MVLDINNRVVYGFEHRHKTIELSMVLDINNRVVYDFGHKQ